MTKTAATVTQLNEIAHLDVLFFGYIPLITVTLDTFLVFHLSTVVKGKTTVISDETKADEKFTVSGAHLTHSAHLSQKAVINLFTDIRIIENN